MKQPSDGAVMLINTAAGASWLTLQNIEGFFAAGLMIVNFLVAALSLYSLIVKKRQNGKSKIHSGNGESGAGAGKTGPRSHEPPDRRG